MATIADKFGKASIDTDYAIATTVKTTRVSGATVLECFDLSKFSDDTPVFVVTYKKTVDPVTEEVTVTNLISWKALVNTGANTLTNLTLAPGYTDSGNAIGDFVECIPTSYWVNELIAGISVSVNPDGTLKMAAIKTALGGDAADPIVRLNEQSKPFVANGLVWTKTSGVTASMTAGVAYINGIRSVGAVIAAKTFTVSKDTWVSINTAGVIAYNEVTINAASTLPADSIWLARVRTDGTQITYIDQGFNPDLSFSGFDTAFNPVYPRFGDKVIARHTTIVGASTGISGTQVAWNGITGMQVKTVKGRRYRIVIHEGIIDGFGVGANGGFIQLYAHHDPTTTRANQVGVSRHAMITGGAGMDANIDFIGRQEGLSWLNFGAAMANLSGTIQITRGVGYPCSYTLEEI